jgi:hypothetical protein
VALNVHLTRGRGCERHDAFHTGPWLRPPPLACGRDRPDSGEGIEISSLGSVIGNTASNNSLGGIKAIGELVVSDNSANENTSIGIELQDGSSVWNNVANGNTGSGIVTGAGCALLANTAHGNGSGTGITAGSNSGVANNVLTGNGGPQISGSYHETDANVCGTNLVCP